MNFKSSAFQNVEVLGHNVSVRKGANDLLYIHSNIPLESHPYRITEKLRYWAKNTPEAIFLGQRNKAGDWTTITYLETWRKVQSIAQFLLNIGLSVEQPLTVLSGNSIEHALISLAAMHIGIPYSPMSPALLKKSKDFTKLNHCLDLLNPGLIFVQDGRFFSQRVSERKIFVIAAAHVQEGQLSFADVLETNPTSAITAAFEALTSDTIAKILFTSGTTGLAKGVVNTHGNITTNWQQLTQTLPFMKNDKVGVKLIDWLPWHHVFGGNHNFGIALYNGGSLFIDEGKPTPEDISITLKNLKDIAPTIYFNVPKGFEVLVKNLKKDQELCRFFFSELKLLFCAGASMPQHVRDSLEQLSNDTLGKRILISTGYGMTEASPTCLLNTNYWDKSGHLGVPVPGLQVKLVSNGDKTEAFFKGDNLTPGYWKNPQATENAFDDEGYYKSGDALKLVASEDPNQGLLFDGRITQDFKLDTGTWVRVGHLREQLIHVANGLIHDAVITGQDRSFVGAIVFPEMEHCKKIASLPDGSTYQEIINNDVVIGALQEIVNNLGAASTGSSTLIKRVIFADFELSKEKGEITDKGSINQQMIRNNKASFVDKLYESKVSQKVIPYQKNTNIDVS